MSYSKDLAIIIPACDAYIDVFDEYMRYFRMNWPDCPFELILVTETKKYYDERVTSVITSKTTEWTGRVLRGLEVTKCQYIFTSVEDGFISKKVNTHEILDIIEFMKKDKILYYGIPKYDTETIKNPLCKNHPNAYKIRKNKAYGIGLGYVFWNRDKLIEVFGDGSRNAWQIEEYFNEIASKSHEGFYDDMVFDKHNVLHIVETVTGGKWMPFEIKKLEKLGIPVKLGERAILPKSDAYRRKIHSIANKIIPVKYRRTIKKFLSKLGYKFVTKS